MLSFKVLNILNLSWNKLFNSFITSSNLKCFYGWCRFKIRLLIMCTELWLKTIFNQNFLLFPQYFPPNHRQITSFKPPLNFLRLTLIAHFDSTSSFNEKASENIFRKGVNAGNQHLLLFPKRFFFFCLIRDRNRHMRCTCHLQEAFNLALSKINSFGQRSEFLQVYIYVRVCHLIKSYLMLIDWLIDRFYKAVFNINSVITRRPVNLSMLSRSSFNQYSKQFSFQATGCFPI